MSLKRSACGFTLAELLMALLILGVISTFTIPKVLNSQANAQRKAVFRSNLATLSSLLYQSGVDNVVPGANFPTYMMGRLNAVKVCNSNSYKQGCWSSTIPPGNDRTWPGILTHDGASVTFYPGGWVSNTITGACVDWNGLKGPNIAGDDIICFDIHYYVGSEYQGTKAAKLVPCDGSNVYTTLLNEVFSP